MELAEIKKKTRLIWYTSPEDIGYTDELKVIPHIEEQFIDMPDYWSFRIYGNIKVAFDWDGTLKKYPYHFKRLIEKLKNGGAKVFLITGRPPSNMPKVLELTDHIGIKLDAYYNYPFEYDVSEFDYHRSCEIGEWKGKICRDLGIDVIFEDMFLHSKLIIRNSPETICLMPFGKT